MGWLAVSSTLGVAVDGQAAHGGEDAAVGREREVARARERNGRGQIAVEVLIDTVFEESVVARNGVGQTLRVDTAGLR